MRRWKEKNDFWLRVRDLRNKWAASKGSDVIQAIYFSVLKGNPFSQKLWMQAFEGFEEKKEIKENEKEEYHPNDFRYIIGQFPEPQRSKCWSYIREIVEYAQRLRNENQLVDLPIHRNDNEDPLFISEQPTLEAPKEEVKKEIIYHSLKAEMELKNT